MEAWQKHDLLSCTSDGIFEHGQALALNQYGHHGSSALCYLQDGLQPLLPIKVAAMSF